MSTAHNLALRLAHSAAPALQALNRRLGGAARRLSAVPGLDDQLRAMLLARDAARLPRYDQVPPRVARRSLQLQSVLAERRPPPIAAVRDLTLPGATGPLPARWYTPHDRTGATILWLHGGGFVVGDLDSHDTPCRRLAADTGAEVVALHYRLAPEHPFPAAWDDVLVAFDALRGMVAGPLAVGGDSAGGNLTAHVALSRPGAQALQVLLYPGTDFTRSLPSHQRLGRGFFLDTPLLDWFCAHAIAPELRADPRCSPLFAAIPPGVAPALVVTAGFDPLLDEGQAFAQRLREAGVTVDEWCEDRLIHGYLSMTGVSQAADQAVGRLNRRIRAALCA